MEIAWYGLSCFRLTERGKATVVSDPYDHAKVGYGPLKLRADILTISHDAAGHNFQKGVRGVKHVLQGPGEYEIGDVFVTGVRPAARKNSRAMEKPSTLYVYDYDGITVAHLGDLPRSLLQSEVDALGTVNVALVPVGGGTSLTASQAAEVISMLDPGIVIPMHYKTRETTLDLDPLDKFVKEMGLGDLQPVPSLKVTKSSIPEDTQVVLLKAAG